MKKRSFFKKKEQKCILYSSAYALMYWEWYSIDKLFEKLL